MLWFSLGLIAAGLIACASAPSAPDEVIAPTQPTATKNQVAQAPAQAPAQTPEPTPIAWASTTTFTWQLPDGLPLPILPPENPMSEAKFQLGRHLFYDRRLSGNNTQSCSTCHIQKLAFTDGAIRSTGSTGQRLARNSQALVNVAYNSSLTWANPILERIEQQIQIPMFGEFPVELGITGNEEVVLARFTGDARYQKLFAQAFPEDSAPINFKNIVYALAVFTRGLTSFDSAYDRFIAGDPDAMNESAQRGMSLFLSEQLECHHCHTGFNFTQSTAHADSTFIEKPFFNTGLYNLDGLGAYPPDNEGIKEVTNNPNDMGRFRPPTLRNIALTGPYMHDGSLATLEDVVQFYERGGRRIETGAYAGDGQLSPMKNGLVAGFQISDQERQDLLAFLHSLTDQSFVTNPRFSDPFSEEPAQYK